MRWTDLATRVVVPHLAVVYRKKCLQVYKNPIGICVAEVASGYRSNVEYTGSGAVDTALRLIADVRNLGV